MFGSKRPTDNPAARPKRVKGEAAPTLQELKALQNQSNEMRNKEIEILWQLPNHPNNYMLRISTAMGPVEPLWIFWEDDGSEMKQVFQYNTIDTDLINDCIQMQLAALFPAAPASATPIIPAATESTAPTGQFVQPPTAAQPFPAAAAPQAPFPHATPPFPAPQNPFPAATPFRNQGVPQAPFPQAAPPFPGQPGGQNPFPQAAPPFPGQGSGQNPFPQAGPAFPTQTGSHSPYPTAAPSGPPAPTMSQAAAQAPPGRPPGLFENDDGFPKAPGKEPIPSTLPVYPQFSDSAPPRPKADIEGTLDDMKVSQLIQTIVTKRMTGKLEIIGEESVGSVFFAGGVASHATTNSAYGDGAIRELVTWEKGSYSFINNATTDMKSIQGRLETTVQEGLTMLDQKRHLKRLGLSFESLLLRKHKNLSETELKLMLMKGAQIDFEFQKKIYDYLKHKRTFTDLLRDYPMDSTAWTGLIFNFISCGLIEIKEADSVQSDVLDFLGADKDHVKKFENSLIRPETGLYSYEAFLYFLEYEFHRFEAYNYPLSLVLFEVLRKRQDGSGGTDLITGNAASMVAQRINLVKRKLDLLGHFQTLDFALLLPNTKGSSAAWLTNRIFETLTATPLGKDLDRTTLHLAFGVASLPADGDSLQSLIVAAQQAKNDAKVGTFPVVLSRGAKK